MAHSIYDCTACCFSFGILLIGLYSCTHVPYIIGSSKIISKHVRVQLCLFYRISLISLYTVRRIRSIKMISESVWLRLVQLQHAALPCPYTTSVDHETQLEVLCSFWLCYRSFARNHPSVFLLSLRDCKFNQVSTEEFRRRLQAAAHPVFFSCSVCHVPLSCSCLLLP
jgi:hypothetical protein